MKAQEFVDEVGKIAAKSGSDLRDKPLEATCWYIAYRYAEQLRELSTKELAHYVQDGFPNVENHVDSVQEMLDELLEDDEATIAGLMDDVRRFYPDVSDATVPPDKDEAI